MKFLKPAIACGLITAAFATSTPVRAIETCDSCLSHYNVCMAAGGNSSTCWSCNNPRCLPPSSRDALQDALGKLSTRKSDLLTPAGKQGVVTRQES
jgi:hypothetical protein